MGCGDCCGEGLKIDSGGAGGIGDGEGSWG